MASRRQNHPSIDRKPGRLVLVVQNQFVRDWLENALERFAKKGRRHALQTTEALADWQRHGYRGRPLWTNWCRIKDGNADAFRIFQRHYSATNRTPKIRQFVGPGEKEVLLTHNGQALFAWRKERYRQDGQHGINCSVFRNEGTIQSSLLIREAMEVAWERWPGERLFTFVDPHKIRSSHPGCCFLKANWRKCGRSRQGLLIFEALPPRLAVADYQLLKQ